MSAHRAIRRAELLLPGTPAAAGDDRRWLLILKIGEYIESDPEEVWQFVRRWGTHRQRDFRDAIACCLLEHLLEHHFDLLFPRVKEAAMKNKLFADTFTRCWKLGQAESSENSKKFDSLLAKCQKRNRRTTRTE